MKLKVALLYIQESVLKAKVSNVHVTCPADAYNAENFCTK